MDAPRITERNRRIQKKRENQIIDRRKETLIKKAFELGEFDGIDVALIICKHGRYTTFQSTDRTTWPPSMEEIVSGYLSSKAKMSSDLIQQAAYPLPKKLLAEDVKKRSPRRRKLSLENDRPIDEMLGRQRSC